MKIKKSFLLVLMAFFIGIGCEKNSSGDPVDPVDPPGATYCWQLLDVAGNVMGKLCDRTEAQMKDSFPIPCSYYKLGDSVFCWLIDGSTYIENVPEDYIKRFIKCYNKTSYTRVTCGYCQFWYTRQKEMYKPTKKASYSPVQHKSLCR